MSLIVGGRVLTWPGGSRVADGRGDPAITRNDDGRSGQHPAILPLTQHNQPINRLQGLHDVLSDLYCSFGQQHLEFRGVTVELFVQRFFRF